MDIDTLLKGSGRIFQTSFPGEGVSFSWRLLSLKEYKVLTSLRGGGVLSPDLAAEEAFKRCYLGDADYLRDDLPFGLTVSVGHLILYLSGDSEQNTLKEDIKAARRAFPAGSVLDYMLATINLVWKNYTYEDVQSWTRPEMIEKFTIAENILSMQNPEFERMDLKKIKTAEELAQEKRKNNSIDFARENRSIRKATGAWASQEAKETRLDVSGLRELDKRRQVRDEFMS